MTQNVHIWGYCSEEDLNNDKGEHIDSMTQEEWGEHDGSLIRDNEDNYFHVSVINDNGKTLSC